MERQAAWSGVKTAERVELAAAPAHVEEVFSRLAAAGAPVCALFGGAARDADLGALWGEPRAIKDYDLRCWLAPEFLSHPDWEARFGQALLSAFPASRLEMEPSAGTGRLRHVLRWEGVELDISARPAPSAHATPAQCAIDRALDSDASLSAVAIASDMSAWCESRYLSDRQTRTLSFYPGVEPERLAAYSQRMTAKFPKASVCFLRPANPPAQPLKTRRPA